jgi:hypothetical protein
MFKLRCYKITFKKPWSEQTMAFFMATSKEGLKCGLFTGDQNEGTVKVPYFIYLGKKRSDNSQ